MSTLVDQNTIKIDVMFLPGKVMKPQKPMNQWFSGLLLGLIESQGQLTTYMTKFSFYLRARYLMAPRVHENMK